MKKVSVITVNYNGKKFLGPLYNSLAKTTYPNIELILVDNDSKDQSVEYVIENYPDVKVVQNRNTGYGGGCNIGYAHSSGEYIVIITMDCTVEPDWLTPLVNFFENHRNVGLLGSVKLQMDLQEHLDLKKVRTLLSENIQTNIVSGSLLFTSRKNIEKEGFFDEDYFMYWEDTDLAYRFSMRGYKNYIVKDSIYYHYRGGVTNIRGQTKTKKLFKRLIPKGTFNAIYYFYRNELFFASKTFGIPLIIKFYVRSFLRSIYNLVIRRNPNQIVSFFYSIKWLLKNKNMIREKRRQSLKKKILSDGELMKIHKAYKKHQKPKAKYIRSLLKKYNL